MDSAGDVQGREDGLDVRFSEQAKRGQREIRVQDIRMGRSVEFAETTNGWVLHPKQERAKRRPVDQGLGVQHRPI